MPEAGRLLLSTSADVRSADDVITFEGHLSDVDVVKFHPNTNYIATGSTDKSCRLWDVTTGECVRVFEGTVRPACCPFGVSGLGPRVWWWWWWWW